MLYKFTESDEVCSADSYDALLTQVKDKSPFTSEMSLDEYRKFAVGNAAGFGKQLPENATSKEITDTWVELGIITIIGS